MQARDSGRVEHPDLDVVELHALARADLAGLAQLGDAIHRHRAAGDEGLAPAAAVGQADEFQELVELDVVAVEGEVDGRHVKASLDRAGASAAYGSGGVAASAFE